MNLPDSDIEGSGARFDIAAGAATSLPPGLREAESQTGGDDAVPNESDPREIFVAPNVHHARDHERGTQQPHVGHPWEGEMPARASGADPRREKLYSGTPAQQGFPPTTVVSNLKKLARLQDRFLTSQSRLKSARDSAGYRFANLKESLADFVQTRGLQEAQEPQNDAPDIREDAHQKLVHGIESLETEMQEVTQLEQALGKLEYRIARLQPKLVKSIDDWINSHTLHEQNSSPARSRSSSRSPPPALLAAQQEYFQQRGRVRLIQNKIFNLQSELTTAQEQAQEATLAHVQSFGDDKPPQANYELLDRLQNDFEQLQQELQREELGLANLWEVCNQAGFDVGPLDAELGRAALGVTQIPATEFAPLPVGSDPNKVNIDSPPFFLDSMMPEFLKNTSWPQRGTFVLPTWQDLPALNDKREYIEHWRGRIMDIPKIVFGSGDDPSPALDIERDYVIINADDLDVPDGSSSSRKGARKVLRTWRSDDALTHSSRRTSRSHLSALDVEQGQHTTHP